MECHAVQARRLMPVLDFEFEFLRQVLDLRKYSGRHSNDGRIKSIVGSINDRVKVDESVAGSSAVVCAVTPHISSAPWNQ